MPETSIFNNSMLDVVEAVSEQLMIKNKLKITVVKEISFLIIFIDFTLYFFYIIIF